MSDTLTEKRHQAASWYEAAAAREGGAIARWFRVFAERIRAGDADRRLDALIEGQSAYDAACQQAA